MRTQRPFHEQLEMVEVEVLSMGGLVERAIGKSIEALRDGDASLADEVIAGDDEIDRIYLMVEEHTLQLLALQTPVAVDLRLVSAVLHANLHLERVGDIAVNIAKIAKATRGLPPKVSMMDHLWKMCEAVREMLRTSIQAFAQRDLDLALLLPVMDEPVDRINRGMYQEVAASTSDPALLEWAVRMMIVSRQLERVGDHAVDIAEQVAFLLTGQFREFSDASHHSYDGGDER